MPLLLIARTGRFFICSASLCTYHCLTLAKIRNPKKLYAGASHCVGGTAGLQMALKHRAGCLRGRHAQCRGSSLQSTGLLWRLLGLGKVRHTVGFGVGRRGANKTDRQEGQLESLQVYWECVVGHLFTSSTSTRISAWQWKRGKAAGTFPVWEGFLTTRSAWLLTSQQANSICPLAPRLLTSPGSLSNVEQFRGRWWGVSCRRQCHMSLQLLLITSLSLGYKAVSAQYCHLSPFFQHLCTSRQGHRYFPHISIHEPQFSELWVGIIIILCSSRRLLVLHEVIHWKLVTQYLIDAVNCFCLVFMFLVLILNLGLTHVTQVC